MSVVQSLKVYILVLIVGMVMFAAIGGHVNVERVFFACWGGVSVTFIHWASTHGVRPETSKLGAGASSVLASVAEDLVRAETAEYTRNGVRATLTINLKQEHK